MGVRPSRSGIVWHMCMGDFWQARAIRRMDTLTCTEKEHNHSGAGVCNLAVGLMLVIDKIAMQGGTQGRYACVCVSACAVELFCWLNIFNLGRSPTEMLQICCKSE